MENKISFVKAAEMRDQLTTENLRRELFDLLIIRGWTFKTIIDSFNKTRESLNKNPEHPSNIRLALKGVKKYRYIASEIENMIREIDGPNIKSLSIVNKL